MNSQRADSTKPSSGVGYGWWMGVMDDGRDLYFDPAEWFAQGLITAPVAFVGCLSDIPELSALPAGRAAVLPSGAVQSRSVSADPRVARVIVRRSLSGDSTFEIFNTEDDGWLSESFTRDSGTRKGYRSPEHPRWKVFEEYYSSAISAVSDTIQSTELFEGIVEAAEKCVDSRDRRAVSIALCVLKKLDRLDDVDATSADEPDLLVREVVAGTRP